MSLLRGCVFFLIIILAGAKYKWTKNVTGQRCEWEGKNGTCISFWTCLTNAVDAVVHNKYPPVCDVRDGEVYACCTGCDLVANISSIVIIKNKRLILERTGSKSYDQCIRYMQENEYSCFPTNFMFKEFDKVYHDDRQCYISSQLSDAGYASGGVNAFREEFPHMALLGYGDDQESAQWLCGGSIISEWFILTAAHCRVAYGGIEVQFAALGILKRSDPPSLWQVYRVAQFIPHPEYRALVSIYNDIALIRTDRQISFNNAVLPACLPYEQPHPLFSSFSATGWGQVRHRAAVADVLQKVWLTPFNESLCSKYYGVSRTLAKGYDHKRQLCCGDLYEDRDTCDGDSGGPLQLSDCPHVVFGVTSVGHPCGFPGNAGLYTRVAYYVPWIESIVCDVRDGEVYTCCTGCDLVANISSIVIIQKHGWVLERTGSKSYDQCIRYMQDNVYPCYNKQGFKEAGKEYDDKSQCYYENNQYGGTYPIAGGVNASREEFPHMALLGYGKDQESAQWLCGGSVISEWFILTAGHCWVTYGGLEVQFAALGVLARSDPPSLWQVYRVAQFIPHPEYRPPSKYNDIVLIRTDREISFKNGVLPACLPQGKPEDVYLTAKATGWGAVRHRGGVANVLQKVWLTGYNDSLCYEYYGVSRTLAGGFDRNTQLCYGDPNGDRDTCEGDSGGPLQLVQCPHVVLGVTSAGHPCGFPEGAALYTRVLAYVPWIESIVWT